jgi:hypothetical protein
VSILANTSEFFAYVIVDHFEFIHRILGTVQLTRMNLRLTMKNLREFEVILAKARVRASVVEERRRKSKGEEGSVKPTINLDDYNKMLLK